MPSKSISPWLQQARAVFFDLDGTLVDSARDLSAACDVLCDALALPRPSREQVGDWIGNGVPKLIERTVRHGAAQVGKSLSDFDLSAAKSCFDAAYRQLVGRHSCLFPGAREGLKKVRATGKPMVCITNKPLELTETLLRQFGVSDWFTLILAGDNVARKKPDPWPLRHAAEFMRVPVTECLMVGDSRHDIQAAKAAPCPVVCVSYGYNHGDDIAGFGADAVLDSLAQL